MHASNNIHTSNNNWPKVRNWKKVLITYTIFMLVMLMKINVFFFSNAFTVIFLQQHCLIDNLLFLVLNWNHESLQLTLRSVETTKNIYNVQVKSVVINAYPMCVYHTTLLLFFYVASLYLIYAINIAFDAGYTHFTPFWHSKSHCRWNDVGNLAYDVYGRMLKVCVNGLWRELDVSKSKYFTIINWTFRWQQ